MEPNTLLVKWPSVPVKSIEPEIVIYQIVPSLILVPPGHPEGYLEAFANLYKNFFDIICKIRRKRTNRTNA
jgi:hypothetical protein